MVWSFIGVYIKGRTLHCSLKITNLFSHVKSVSLMRYFSILEGNFSISAWPYITNLWITTVHDDLQAKPIALLKWLTMHYISRLKFLLLANILRVNLLNASHTEQYHCNELTLPHKCWRVRKSECQWRFYFRDLPSNRITIRWIGHGGCSWAGRQSSQPSWSSFRFLLLTFPSKSKRAS